MVAIITYNFVGWIHLLKEGNNESKGLKFSISTYIHLLKSCLCLIFIPEFLLEYSTQTSTELYIFIFSSLNLLHYSKISLCQLGFPVMNKTTSYAAYYQQINVLEECYEDHMNVRESGSCRKQELLTTLL